MPYAVDYYKNASGRCDVTTFDVLNIDGKKQREIPGRLINQAEERLADWKRRHSST